MLLKEFLKDKLLTIFLLFGTITIEILLAIYPFGKILKIYVPIAILGLYAISLMVEYVVKKRFYEKIELILNGLDEKYLIAELIQSPHFMEGKILKEILEQTDKSMLENVNQYKYLTEDYKDYIELWIHEIKIPIATTKLIIENNKSTITKNIDEELNRVEDYVEQALFYARSNTVEKDYYIKKVMVKDMVNECIKKNKNVLIQEKISMNLHDLDVFVYTDSKWLVFILNQIIQNSVKYKKDKNAEIEIEAKQGKENVILLIHDNGIGIKKGEITRVFEKGFTGTNGRLSHKKSTGIGLYLCQKLCQKLSIAIELNSVENEGTEVRLVFPKGSYMEL